MAKIERKYMAHFINAAKSGEDEKKANLKWLFLCLIAFAATGGIGVMQKVHQSSSYRDELNAFLIVAFIASAFLCSIFAYLLKTRSEEAKEQEEKSQQA